MIILGIDPGLADTGWGVVEYSKQRFRPVSFGVIKTKPGKDLQSRILDITSRLAEVADKYKPDCAGMEDIFFMPNSRNSAMQVAKVIGAVLAELGKKGIPCKMFTPLQIKQSVTGYGQADKNQVQQMSRLLLGLDEIVKPDHAADALSAAICTGNTIATEAVVRGC